MVRVPKLKYRDLLLEERLGEHEREKEKQLENSINVWDLFLSGSQDTVGVENIYFASVKGEERQDYLGVKARFKPLSMYAGEGFMYDPPRERLKNVGKYSNESTALRLYSFLKTLSFLGGHNYDTYVSTKSTAIVNNWSSASRLGKALYPEKFLLRKQERETESEEEIYYTLTCRGMKTIARTDVKWREIDERSWKGFRRLLHSRVRAFSRLGKIKGTLERREYSSGKGVTDFLVYSDVKRKPREEVFVTV